MEVESCFEDWRLVIDLAAHDGRPSSNFIKGEPFTRIFHSAEGLRSGRPAPYLALLAWRKYEFIGRDHMELLIIITLLGMFSLRVVHHLFLLVVEHIFKISYHLGHIRSRFLLDVPTGCLSAGLLESKDLFRDQVCRKLFATLAVQGQDVVQLLLVVNFIKNLRLDSLIRSSVCRIFHF